MSAANLRRRLSWFQESHGQLCVWSREHPEESCVFSAVIGVFAGLMSATVRMYRKRASRSRFVKGVVSLPRKLVESRSGPGSKRSSKSIRTRSRALRSIAPDVVLDSSDEGEVSLARRVARTSRKCRCNFCIPRNEVGDVRGFLSREKRPSCRSTFHLLSCSTCRELDKGSRFFDCDYDSSKSLLHVLAQRLTRSSPARTCDLDCFSPSLMHVDGGEVDLTPRIHVPTVSVQSHVSSDVLSSCTGHAAVSSQSPSVTRKMIASAARCLISPVLQ